jgi:hypothetical protein
MVGIQLSTNEELSGSEPRKTVTPSQ